MPTPKILSLLTTFFLFFVLTAPANAVPVSGQGTWETTLLGRDLDGIPATFEAYYDTVLDITWLADANAAGTTMTWADANTWAAGLDINGVTGWRLPDTNPIDGTTADDETYSDIGTEDYGYNVSAPGTLYAGNTASEMAHMFYNTLGDLGYVDTSGSYPQPDWGLSNTGPFNNLQSDDYWSGTEFAPNPSYAWKFLFDYGFQSSAHKGSVYYAWDVRPGDVAAVPEPGTLFLLGTGLSGLFVLRKRTRRLHG